MEHLEGLAGVLQGDTGAGGDDDGPGERNGLHERDDDVAGAGRQIDDEEVELAPGDLLEKTA